MSRCWISWTLAVALALAVTACAGPTAETAISTAATRTTAATTTSTAVTTTTTTTSTTTTTRPPTTTTTSPALNIVEGPIQADARVVDWDAFYAGEGVNQLPGLIEVYVGSGDDIVDLQQGLSFAVVTLSHRGNRNFIVHAIFSDGSDEGLVNVIGPYQGKRVAARSGVDLTGLEIRADGDWVAIASTILLSSTGDEVARQYEGVGDSVIVFPTVTQSPLEPVTAFSKVTLAHDGDSNFIVHELLGPGLVNEIGPYSGTVRLSSDGIFGLEITADGAWTVSFG